MARGKLLIGLAVVAAAYIGYPYVALYRVETAVERNDTAAIESMVDWPRVRQSFKTQLGAKPPARSEDGDGLAQLGAALSRSLVGGAVDSLVTPESLIRMIQSGRPERAAASALLGSGASDDNGNRRPQTVWAFFTGPAGFRARVHGTDQPSGEAPVELQFDLIGGVWLVTEVVPPPSR